MTTETEGSSSAAMTFPASIDGLLGSSDTIADFAFLPDSELPAYSEQRTRTVRNHTTRTRVEHQASLIDKEGRSWCTLKVKSWSRIRSLPVILEGEQVSGKVELNLAKPDNIKAIIVSVKGTVIYSEYHMQNFLELSQVLWESGTSGARNRKLEGQHLWPFNIDLPKDIAFTPKRAKELNVSAVERLPPHLTGKGWTSSIVYQVVVDIKRKGAFQTGSSLTSQIGYVPLTKPKPPSQLRRLAYQENVPVLGPDVDPQGWKAFQDVEIKGKLFKAVDVNVTCSLSLATPLEYTRGTAIPCALTLASSSKQAIDLLLTPQAVVVQLRRKLKSAIPTNFTGSSITTAKSEEKSSLARASWYPPSDSTEADGLYKRSMLGEIALPVDLVPSFKFGQFDCRYYLDVYPPEAAGFVPRSDFRLLREEVTISASLPEGPRPKSYLPPGYGALRQSLDGDNRRGSRLHGFM